MKSARDFLVAQNEKEDGLVKVAPGTITFLEKHIAESDTKMENIKSEISDLEKRIENQFNGKDMQKVGYKLHSVFIHRGQATFGHYWVYIRDFQRGIYRIYNDKTISEAPENEVTGSDLKDSEATAYYVTYVRDDLTTSLVNAVVRDIDGYITDDEENDDNDIQIDSKPMSAQSSLNSNQETHKENIPPSLPHRNLPPNPSDSGNLAPPPPSVFAIAAAAASASVGKLNDSDSTNSGNFLSPLKTNENYNNTTTENFSSNGIQDTEMTSPISINANLNHTTNKNVPLASSSSSSLDPLSVNNNNQTNLLDQTPQKEEEKVDDETNKKNKEKINNDDTENENLIDIDE